jgi:CO/xanthine dehydrogenase FAD-binding subunit
MNAPLAAEIAEPKSIDEALAILDKGEGNTAIIAGGTDLVIKLKEGVIQPSILVDLMHLPLNHIEGSRVKGFKIGATTTAREIAESSLLTKELPVLTDAAIHLGGPQTQEVATIGGNICNASPCANFTNVLVALEAKVKVSSVQGEREELISGFCRGPGVVHLDHSELVTEIFIPPVENPYGASYVKHTLRREMDIAIVGAAAIIVPERNSIKRVRIALGSVGATVVLAESAQGILEGKAFTPHIVETAAEAAAERDASYIDDVRSSAAYRKIITRVAVRRALQEAWANAKGVGK